SPGAAGARNTPAAAWSSGPTAPSNPPRSEGGIGAEEGRGSRADRTGTERSGREGPSPPRPLPASGISPVPRPPSLVPWSLSLDPWSLSLDPLPSSPPPPVARLTAGG